MAAGSEGEAGGVEVVVGGGGGGGGGHGGMRTGGRRGEGTSPVGERERKRHGTSRRPRASEVNYFCAAELR